MAVKGHKWKILATIFHVALYLNWGESFGRGVGELCAGWVPVEIWHEMPGDAMSRTKMELKQPADGDSDVQISEHPVNWYWWDRVLWWSSCCELEWRALSFHLIAFAITEVTNHPSKFLEWIKFQISIFRTLSEMTLKIYENMTIPATGPKNLSFLGKEPLVHSTQTRWPVTHWGEEGEIFSASESEAGQGYPDDSQRYLQKYWVKQKWQKDPRFTQWSLTWSHG